MILLYNRDYRLSSIAFPWNTVNQGYFMGPIIVLLEVSKADIIGIIDPELVDAGAQ